MAIYGSVKWLQYQEQTKNKYLALIINQITMDFTSPMHLLLILLVIVLLFGGKKIPELMKGIGQGMKEFKKASEYDPGKEDDKKSTSELARKE
jgi:sec-independent protein translocase protein TatA